MPLREPFEAVTPGTVGLEEEVLLLDPATLQPKPCAAEVLLRAAGDERLKLELPAAQIELITRPHARVEDAVAELAAARSALVAYADGIARPAAAALHPDCRGGAELNRGGRYDSTTERYGIVARRQLLGALQVHVAVGGAVRSLAVYNGLIAHLPLLAALAAAAPFHGGEDTGLASMRPLVGGQLPRQGVPPVIGSWEVFAAELEWGRRAGFLGEQQGGWWWELRPHLAHGTLELRVPDVQPTLAQAAAVVHTAVALVRHLGARHDAGATLPAHPAWRVAENRWEALRGGVEGDLADLTTGARRPTREWLLELLDTVEPHAEVSLDPARAMVERNGAMQLREVGVRTAAGWLADRFSG